MGIVTGDAVKNMISSLLYTIFQRRYVASVREENHPGFCFYSEVSLNKLITESYSIFNKSVKIALVKKYVSIQQCFPIFLHRLLGKVHTLGEEGG
jgi:hypothetical protein